MSIIDNDETTRDVHKSLFSHRCSRHARHRATWHVTDCADTFNAPIVTTWRAKGIIPASDPYLMGVAGRFGTSIADDVVRGADVLHVGSSLSENTTDGWTLISDSTRLIQINIDSRQIGRTQGVTLPIVGDAFLTLELIAHHTPVDPAKRSPNSLALKRKHHATERP